MFDSAGELIGALVIHGPTLRMSYEKCVEWVDLLVGRAEEITRAVGGRYPS